MTYSYIISDFIYGVIQLKFSEKITISIYGTTTIGAMQEHNLQPKSVLRR